MACRSQWGDRRGITAPKAGKLEELARPRAVQHADVGCSVSRSGPRVPLPFCAKWIDLQRQESSSGPSDRGDWEAPVLHHGLCREGQIAREPD